MKLRLSCLLVPAAVLMTVNPVIAEEPKSTDAKPEQAAAAAPDKDKASYAIGMDIATGLKRSGIDVDANQVAKGIVETMNGKASLSEEDAQKVLMALQEDLRSKRQAAQDAAGKVNKDEGEKFLSANKAKEGVKTTASGLQYKVITEGKGDKPKSSDTVTVNYRGTLISGTEFDSSYKRNEPATFPLDGVIPGWTEGLQLMTVGSKYQFFIPASLAYGESGPPGIGPNQTLIFEVELLKVQKGEKEKK